MDLAAFYRGRKVLLTGHTGFKGAWLSHWLDRLGAEVAGYALAPVPGPNLWTDLGLPTRMRSHLGDIRDPGALQTVLAAFRPEVVLHLAAQAQVLPSYADPVGTFAINLMGTVNLLEACRGLPSLRSLVVVTSDKCYRQPGERPFREDDPLGGGDPYSASKACAELATASYRHAFFQDRVGLATARAGNVIGGGDWAERRLVPELVRAIQDGRPLKVRWPESRRPWQHVLEPLEGYLRLGARLAEDPTGASGPWNFGPPEAEAWTVAAVVEACCQAWGETGGWEREVAPTQPEADQLALDSAKARERLGWRPRWTVGEATRRSMDWYRAFAEGASARALCDADLEAHE